MKRETILFFFLLVICLRTQAQNLVPNPSFEEYKKLDCWFIQYSVGLRHQDPQKTFDSLLYYWTLPNLDNSEVLSDLISPDCSENHSACTDCSSSPVNCGIVPKDGHNFAAIHLLIGYDPGIDDATGSRSYVQTPLMNALEPGAKYLAGCYHVVGAFSLSLTSYLNSGNYVCNNLGLFFSTQPVGSNTFNVIEGQPQVNQNEVDVPDGRWRMLYGCFTARGGEQYLTLGNFKTDKETTIKIRLDPTGQGGSVAYSMIDSVFVEKIEEPFVPNVITPNGDGLNEKFIIQNIHQGWWSLTVYNRWGGLAYQANEYKNDWNGGNLNAGVYFYELKHKCSGIQYKGTLTILR